MLPFTAEQFFAVFAAYNAATWPAPVLAYLLGAAALALALRGGAVADRAVPAVLGGLWLWTGIAYHWLHFAPVNPAARLFALAFAAQGGLLVYLGSVRRRLLFGWRAGTGAAVGLLLAGYAAVLYPLLGRLTGHIWPAAPTFGVTPCPLTIFTFGLLLFTRGRVPPVLLAIPALWSLVGGTAAVLLQVPQDWMLPVAGTLGTALLARGSHRPGLGATHRAASRCP
jgi:hypothetical protein